MPRKNSFITATDQFCGAGGSTTGAKAAGVEVKMALNHWHLAIETHNTNHPEVLHDCTDVQACDPRKYPSTNILITSPECTNHSLAKGQKRKYQNQLKLFGRVEISAEEERSRATMWDVPRFAEFHDYEIIIVENVVDARYWRLWDAWLLAMHNLGYNHECSYLNSMFFHPCPQSRDRMYVVFWKKGNPRPDLNFRPIAPCPDCGDRETFQSWKRADKKWGKYNQQYVYRCSACNKVVTPYYFCAFNAIDWTIPGQRIGDRKRPLAPKTMERIRYGLEKYGNRHLIISPRYTHGLNRRVKPVCSPVPTQLTEVKHGLLSPFLINLEHSKVDAKFRVKPAYEALFTQTTSQATGIVVPMIVELKGGYIARKLDVPLSTILAGGWHHMLIGNYTPGWARTLEKPTGTITTSDSQALFSTDKMSSFLSYYYSGSNQYSSVTEPVSTVTTNDRAALTQPNGVKIEDCYYRMLRDHEVQAAMAFPEDYIILGNAKQKINQLGNAVTPPVMEWLVSQAVKTLT